MPMIGGRYRLIAEVGTGGTASVWRAVDVRLERTVAIKSCYLSSPACHALVSAPRPRPGPRQDAEPSAVTGTPGSVAIVLTR
ncbi:hypothetical protein GCM10009827_114700 [Dactylosporangium maewongense]|uniref:Protein kinase domain-containing protein n=1 Tax=Dactylosporangium maewongense TaxID=634393 RepID=A0ABN2DBV4_9ACTN